MTTSVVSVKVINIRPKYKDLKDWCSDNKFHGDILVQLLNEMFH